MERYVTISQYAYSDLKRQYIDLMQSKSLKVTCTNAAN